MRHEVFNMHMHNPPHPGEVLKELYIEPLNLTIVEIVKGIGVSRKSLSELGVPLAAPDNGTPTWCYAEVVFRKVLKA